MTIRNDQLELAWAAGFFDGEGCVYLAKSPRGHRRLRASITQKDRRPLDRLQRVVGMGIIYGPRSEPPNTHYLYFNRTSTLELYELLKPYLSEPKIEQFERCIGGEVRYSVK